MRTRTEILSPCILDIQIWEVNNSVLVKIGQILQKEKFIKKLYKNCDIKTSSRPFCVCKELSTTSIGK